MRFEKIYIELSDFCGLKCGFCPNATRKTRRGSMELALFEDICAQVRGRARRVCFHILGDPLGVELWRYAAIAKAHNLKVELVTTGLFLKEKDFELLLSAPFVQVAFSLSAFVANPRVLEAGHLEQILRFCDHSVASGSPIFINLRFHSVDIAAESARYRQMLGVITGHFEGLSLAEVEAALKRGERVRLGAKVFLNPTISFEWERDSEVSESSGFSCYGGIGQVGILSDGRVVPCCIDYEGRAAFGTLGEISLGEILDSVLFREFARKMREGIMPHALCEGCGYWRRHL